MVGGKERRRRALTRLSLDEASHSAGSPMHGAVAVVAQRNPSAERAGQARALLGDSTSPASIKTLPFCCNLFLNSFLQPTRSEKDTNHHWCLGRSRILSLCPAVWDFPLHILQAPLPMSFLS